MPLVLMLLLMPLVLMLPLMLLVLMLHLLSGAPPCHHLVGR